MALLFLAACTADPRKEGATLIDLVGRYRLADDAHMAGAGAAVRDFVCNDREVCAAKEACLAFILPTTKAKELEQSLAAKVDALVAKRDAGTLRADNPVRISAEETSLELAHLQEEGHAARDRCEEKLVDLGRK